MKMTREYGVACVQGTTFTCPRGGATRRTASGTCASRSAGRSACCATRPSGWRRWGGIRIRLCNVMCTTANTSANVLAEHMIHKTLKLTGVRVLRIRPRSARAGSRPRPGALPRRARRGASRGRALESPSRPVTGFGQDLAVARESQVATLADGRRLHRQVQHGEVVRVGGRRRHRAIANFDQVGLRLPASRREG